VQKVSSKVPKIHYRVYNRQPRDPVLSQMNPFHNRTVYFFKFNVNIILPPGPRFTRILLFSWIPNKMYTFLTSTMRAVFPVHLPWLNHPNIIYLVRSMGSTNQKAPHYVAVSTLLFLYLSLSHTYIHPPENNVVKSAPSILITKDVIQLTNIPQQNTDCSDTGEQQLQLNTKTRHCRPESH
jgi:hypothetical protein